VSEQELSGGNLGGAVRVANTVRRAAGHWTPAVHALLEHLAKRGFVECPRVLGFDERGREILSYLPGETVGSARPWPSWTRTRQTLLQTARLIRRYHDAVADFVQPAGTRWRLTSAVAQPGEIICHNDIAPYNIVHGPTGVTGMFDWDVAGPGAPEFDLAFSAWQFVPLYDDEQCRELGWSDVSDRPDRLREFVDSYGLKRRQGFVELIATRMQASIDRIRQGADDGDPAFQQLITGGHLAPVRAARERLLRDATLLQRAISQ
jgi:hypothetical protein